MANTVDCDQLYKAVCEIIADYLRTYESRESKVIEFQTPDAVRALVDVRVPEEGQGEEVIIAAIKDVLRYSVRTGKSPSFRLTFKP